MIDVLIGVLLVAAIVLGAQVGLTTIVLGAGGFVVGLFAGSRLIGLVMDDSPWLPVAALLGALFVAGIAQSLGLRFAGRIVRRLGPARVVDQVGGAAGGLAFGLGLVWLLAVVGFAQPAIGIRNELQGSRIATRLVEEVSPEDVLGAIARLDALPRLPALAGVALPPPDASVSRSPVTAAAGRSVVKIEGTSCGAGVQGSGWVAGDGLVVTNVHVVTGQTETRVVAPGGRVARATIVYADRTNDVAILRTRSLGVPALTVGEAPRFGAGVSVLGYPGDGPLVAIPATTGTASRIVTDDVDRSPRLRAVVPLRARVRPGASGGPVVDARGRVVSMIFASTLDGEGGLAVPGSVLRRALARPPVGPVDGGPCAR